MLGLEEDERKSGLRNLDGIFLHLFLFIRQEQMDIHNYDRLTYACNVLLTCKFNSVTIILSERLLILFLLSFCIFPL